MTVLLNIASAGRRRVTAVAVRVRVGMRVSSMRCFHSMRLLACDMLAMRIVIVNRW